MSIELLQIYTTVNDIRIWRLGILGSLEGVYIDMTNTEGVEKPASQWFTLPLNFLQFA